MLAPIQALAVDRLGMELPERFRSLVLATKPSEVCAQSLRGQNRSDSLVRNGAGSPSARSDGGSAVHRRLRF